MNPPQQIPSWVWLPAVGGALFISLPLGAMALAVNWRDFGKLITSESSTAALRLSLQTAAISTVICLILGIPLALLLARSHNRLIEFVRPFVMLPLVLPPVVAGMALLSTFGKRGLVGAQLEAAGLSIAFTTVAVVLAQTFVSLPFLVVSLEGALRSTGTRHEAIAATLGAKPSRVFFRVTIPLVVPGLASGAVLAFARALGEFGATITFAGSLQGVTRTLPLEIYLQRETDPESAIALSLLLVLTAAIVMAGVRRIRGPWA